MPEVPVDVTLTVDGKEVTVAAGTLIIRAAEQLGVQIPRFCDHPLLEPAGACRQCFVEVEGQRKLITSCTTPVAEGMVVKTQNTSDEAQTAQVSNLEFLLLNHPLDCPVCDRGGECPLQDQALEFGPGESRFVEAKRTYEKPVPLSDLVALDRERCVLCARCTRFCDEISGDRQIDLFDRGARQQVAIAPGEEFDSPFSGNTVQICPVGALTARPYRFAARPFDLTHTDSVCEHCSSGCAVRVDARRGEVVRVLARDDLDVNDAWICDKGRFAFQAPDAEDRTTTPLLREGGLVPVSFSEVFGQIAAWSASGPVGFLVGGRLGDVDAYALSKLARVAFATNDLDHRRHLQGGTVERLAAAGALDVTYADVERAKVLVVAGLDTEQESPILHLRVRKAVRRSQARVWVAHGRRTRLHDVSTWLPAHSGFEAAAIAADDEAMAALRAVGADAVVLIGEHVAAHAGAADALLALARDTGARVAFVTRRAGDRGALRAGVHPALLPGGRRVDVETERQAIEAAWGTTVPTTTGRDARQILEATAAREISTIFVIGADPLRDWPDAALAEQALANAEHVVVQGLELGDLEFYADAFLPAAATVERDGSRTTWEGRARPFSALRGPAGSSRADVEIFSGLAQAMGNAIGDPVELTQELDLLQAVVVAVEDDPAAEAATAASAGKPADLTLFSYPLLADEGRLSRGAEAMRSTQEQDAFIEVAVGAGFQDGEQVVVTTSAGLAQLAVRIGDVATGTAFVPFNNPGLAANTLLGGGWSTPAAVEAVEAVEAEAGSD